MSSTADFVRSKAEHAIRVMPSTRPVWPIAALRWGRVEVSISQIYPLAFDAVDPPGFACCARNPVLYVCMYTYVRGGVGDVHRPSLASLQPPTSNISNTNTRQSLSTTTIQTANLKAPTDKSAHFHMASDMMKPRVTGGNDALRCHTVPRLPTSTWKQALDFPPHGQPNPSPQITRAQPTTATATTTTSDPARPPKPCAVRALQGAANNLHLSIATRSGGRLNHNYRFPTRPAAMTQCAHPTRTFLPLLRSQAGLVAASPTSSAQAPGWFPTHLDLGAMPDDPDPAGPSGGITTTTTTGGDHHDNNDERNLHNRHHHCTLA